MVKTCRHRVILEGISDLPPAKRLSAFLDKIIEQGALMPAWTLAREVSYSVSNVGLSPSGKAQDFDSCISWVRIPLDQFRRRACYVK